MDNLPEIIAKGHDYSVSAVPIGEHRAGRFGSRGHRVARTPSHRCSVSHPLPRLSPVGVSPAALRFYTVRSRSADCFWLEADASLRNVRLTACYHGVQYTRPTRSRVPYGRGTFRLTGNATCDHDHCVQGASLHFRTLGPSTPGLHPPAA